MLRTRISRAGGSGPVAAASPPPPRDCHDAAHSAYDCFVGDWDVAHSRIDKMLGDCTIHETFDQILGPDGKPANCHGRSYTALNVRKEQWQQFYVDSNGTASNLRGATSTDGGKTWSAAGYDFTYRRRKG